MGTSFQNAGYTRDTKFKVIKEYKEFLIGDIVVLEEDDGSICPNFHTLSGSKSGYLSLPFTSCAEIEVYDDSQSTFKYPCAVELEGLTWEQAVNLEKAFVKLGVELSDSFTEERRLEGWEYYGVDYCNTTQLYDLLHHYAREDEEVTLYTYEEVMEMVNHINYDISLLGKEVVYNRTGQRYLIEGVDISLETITVGSDKDTGAITCKLEDVSFVDEEGWILNNGTEPQYLLAGGKIDVKYVDGKINKNVTNINRKGDGSTYGAYNWNLYGEGCCVHSWKPSAKSDTPSVASPVDDTDTLEPEVYTDHQEEENASTASVGASVHIFVKLLFNNTDYAISRDEAYKIYQDLKHIFEEKIV